MALSFLGLLQVALLRSNLSCNIVVAGKREHKMPQHMHIHASKCDVFLEGGVPICPGCFCPFVQAFLAHALAGSSQMISKETALPGRSEQMEVSPKHYVLKTPMRGPWPAGRFFFGVFLGGPWSWRLANFGHQNTKTREVTVPLAGIGAIAFQDWRPLSLQMASCLNGGGSGLQHIIFTAIAHIHPYISEVFSMISRLLLVISPFCISWHAVSFVCMANQRCSKTTMTSFIEATWTK